MTTFDLNYSYGQIAIFSSGIDKPFNDWTDRHIRQGFSWRDRSVSFRMLNEEGLCKVSIQIAQAFTPTKGAERAFLVPLVVDKSGVEVASITDQRQVDISLGHYALYCEIGRFEAGAEWMSLLLVKQEHVESQLLLVDSELSPIYPLEMSAKPAEV